MSSPQPSNNTFLNNIKTTTIQPHDNSQAQLQLLRWITIAPDTRILGFLRWVSVVTILFSLYWWANRDCRSRWPRRRLHRASRGRGDCYNPRGFRESCYTRYFSRTYTNAGIELYSKIQERSVLFPWQPARNPDQDYSHGSSLRRFWNQFSENHRQYQWGKSSGMPRGNFKPEHNRNLSWNLGSRRGDTIHDFSTDHSRVYAKCSI